MPTRTAEERARISEGMRRWHAGLRSVAEARDRVLRVLGWMEALHRERAAQHGDALDRFVLNELDRAYDLLCAERTWVASQDATETAHVSPGPSSPVSIETGPRP